MKVNCEIDNIRTLKKGMKIVLNIDEKETIEVMKNIFNFMDKPLTVDFLINADEQMERMNQISPEQRKKIYAIFNDIESYTGETADDVKIKTKNHFIQNSEYEDFSLSNCTKQLAEDFINHLIQLCFEIGVPLSENPAKSYTDIDRYLKLCIEQRKCAICGIDAEIHHWDSVGANGGRKHDDSNLRKIALCRTHHTEAHKIGRDHFQDKYHVYGITT